MLDRLPPELLRLVGEAACPPRHLTQDIVVHGALADASGHLVLTPGRTTLKARQILVQMRAVCRFLRKELPSPRLKYRNVVGPGADGLIASAGTNTWIDYGKQTTGTPMPVRASVDRTLELSTPLRTFEIEP